MTTTIRPWGNSQGLYIPKSMLKQIGLEVNESVTLSVENGALVIRKYAQTDSKTDALESIRSIRLECAGRMAAEISDYRKEYEEYLDERYRR